MTALQALRTALEAAGSPLAAAPFEPLADRGLAHLHVRLGTSGTLARLPKQSQLGLPPHAHLAYEAACFERAAACGHTPALHGILAPSAGLPLGGLLVESIAGRPARLPGDLPAIVDALASLHALPLPPPGTRAPLLDPADALGALRQEIDAQAAHLDAAGIEPAARERIDAERDRLAARCRQPARPPRRLIAFDAHPGNFVVRAGGRAVLVDLEKARYGLAGLDLAHATLYTSTTWDAASSTVLTLDDVVAASRRWLAALPDGALERDWIVPLRRAMWLWSVTWCAKWRVLSGRPPGREGAGEDWSAALSEAALVEHVRDRVDHYLSAPAVDLVCTQADDLAGRL